MNQQFGRQHSGKHPNEQQKRKKNLKNENSLRSLWGIIKYNNIHIIGVPEEEEKEQGIENLFEEIMMKNFPNLVRKIDIQFQEAQSLKQDEPKEANTKTHHNYNGKVQTQRKNFKSSKRKAVSYI